MLLSHLILGALFWTQSSHITFPPMVRDTFQTAKDEP
jgi:hypothetical protein